MNPWPYPSATELVTSHLKKTLVTGNTSFLDKLVPDFVTKDLVNYDHVKKATEKYPRLEEAIRASRSRAIPTNAMEEISHYECTGYDPLHPQSRAERVRLFARLWPGQGLRRVLFPLIGIAVLMALWWIGGQLLYLNPADALVCRTSGPSPTFEAMGTMLAQRRDRVRHGEQSLPHRHRASARRGSRPAGRHHLRPQPGLPRGEQSAVPVPAHDQPALLGADRGARLCDLGPGDHLPDHDGLDLVGGLTPPPTA